MIACVCPCFCQTDPFWTASSLSPSDHREVENQSICSLAELLELAKGNATLLLNLRDPPRDHPYRGSFLNITLEAVLRSGFPQHQVKSSGGPWLSPLQQDLFPFPDFSFPVGKTWLCAPYFPDWPIVGTTDPLNLSEEGGGPCSLVT